MTVREYVMKNKAMEYGALIEAAVKATGAGRDRVQRVVAQVKGREPQAAAAKPARRTINEAELLMETDAETRYTTNMRSILKSLKRGEYVRDFDLRKDVGAAGDAALWREVRKNAQFSAHVMEIGHGREPATYWGHPDSIAGMIARNKAHKPAWMKGVA